MTISSRTDTREGGYSRRLEARPTECRGTLAPLLLVILLFTLSLHAESPQGSKKLPWYMQETAMSSDGRLTFFDKAWWPRAKALTEGQSFSLDLNGDGRPDTMIERRDGDLIEMIDDSGHASDIANNKGDAAYVVSMKGTGLVDRMVVYLDNDQDGKADEMEIRYYRDGYLRFGWFGENYDKDGAEIFALAPEFSLWPILRNQPGAAGAKDWSYDYNGSKEFQSKFRGNTEIYLNKYDAVNRNWLPISECPFIFWDPTRDGRGDVVLRVSAAPLDSNTGKDPDYANNYDYMWAQKANRLSDTGVMNIRFSYNIDPEPRNEPFEKPHYTFGFNLVGAQPYSFPGMAYTNPRRRPPQTVVRIAADSGMEIALHYSAQQSGFTWDEGRTVFRYEGQFWIYERDYMPNTGAPTTRWNMRREYSDKPSSERKIYYSDVDKRYHLWGATEGWLEVGHLINDRKDLEFRYFDSDGDGYLDTTEVFEGSNPVPVRTVQLKNVRARPVVITREAMQDDYNNNVLPIAIRQDQELIAALRQVVNDPLAALYEADAMKATSAERRRYSLDVARELYFLRARDYLYGRNSQSPYSVLNPSSTLRMTPGAAAGQYTVGDTLVYWKIAKQIDRFVETYDNGRFDETVQSINTLRNMLPQR